MTRFITCDDWNPIWEWDASGTGWMRFYGAKADEIIGRWDSTWGFQFYKQDKQGSVVMVLDGGGGVLDKYTYDAFGQPTVTDYWGNVRTDGNGKPVSWCDNRFMFTGREWITELGIYDYRHRYYHPGLGRFLQVDPLGLQTEGEKLSAGQKALFSPGGSAPEAFTTSEMNLFRYCGDDPVDGSDPLGLVDLSYTPTDVPNQRLRAWEATYNNPKAYDVAGHGDRNNMYDQQMKPITPQQVAKDIVKDLNYKPGQSVNLISCETGKGGKGSFGDRLAKELTRETGKPTKVTAPEKEVGPKIDKNGNIVPGSKPQQPGIDMWRRFHGN